ncbi:MAG: hypothetical protein ACRDYY_00035, partial [Acidimicrobiales bacterium]
IFEEVNKVGSPWPAIYADDNYLELSLSYGAPFYLWVPSNESADLLTNPGEDCAYLNSAYNDVYYTNCS